MSDTTWAVAMLLVTARVSGIFLVAPVFSAAVVPLRLRLLMSLVIAQALISAADVTFQPAGMIELLIAIGCELAIGATIGYAASLIFAGVQLGAFHIGQQMGFSLAESFQAGAPETSGILRRFMYLLALVIFLSIGGHREVIMALRNTFAALPLAHLPAGRPLLEMVTTLLTVSFVLALKVAAPLLIAMLLATVALGLLQRTLPQYNTLTIGIPVRVMVGLLVLAASLAVFSPLMERALSLTFTQLNTWLKAAG